MSEQKYMLHGRELKIGDRVWNILSKKFVHIVDPCMLSMHPESYAWDDLHIDIAKIPPPLGFTSDGLPIRKGDAVMYDGRACVVINFDDRKRWWFCAPEGYFICSDVAPTFDFPTAPPKRKVLVEFWINKYPEDLKSHYIGQKSMFRSEQSAAENANKGCQGQEKFSYYVEVDE